VDEAELGRDRHLDRAHVQRRADEAVTTVVVQVVGDDAISPALVVEPLADGHADRDPVGEAGDRLQMHDDAAVAVADPAAALAQAQAQVDVLEGVEVRLVEPLERREVLRAYEQARAGDPDDVAVAVDRGVA
jgi:hypothetical protein